MSEGLKDRIELESALENLVVSEFGYDNSDLSDEDFVDHAAKKLSTLMRYDPCYWVQSWRLYGKLGLDIDTQI